jgi:hypothetical protein
MKFRKKLLLVSSGLNFEMLEFSDAGNPYPYFNGVRAVTASSSDSYEYAGMCIRKGELQELSLNCQYTGCC